MQVNTIAEQLLFTTVRIETITPNGISTGTAFIFNYQEEEKQYVFLVTNKHVIQGAINGRFFFTLSNGQSPQIGQRFDIEVNQFEQRWFGHPDKEIGEIIFISSPVSQVPIVRTQQMIDLGIVYKASTILETVKIFLERWSK